MNLCYFYIQRFFSPSKNALFCCYIHFCWKLPQILHLSVLVSIRLLFFIFDFNFKVNAFPCLLYELGFDCEVSLSILLNFLLITTVIVLCLSGSVIVFIADSALIASCITSCCIIMRLCWLIWRWQSN